MEESPFSCISLPLVTWSATQSCFCQSLGLFVSRIRGPGSEDFELGLDSQFVDRGFFSRCINLSRSKRKNCLAFTCRDLLLWCRGL